MCSLKHIKDLNDERFDERMHSSVLHDWKACLKYFLLDKDMLTNLLACLVPQSESDVASHRHVNADLETSLQFANHLPFEASVNEEEVVKMLSVSKMVIISGSYLIEY